MNILTQPLHLLTETVSRLHSLQDILEHFLLNRKQWYFKSAPYVHAGNKVFVGLKITSITDITLKLFVSQV